ncbi:helix-turn-helix domain-containing protein [Jeotgalibacillus aurantiacus]|uniref:helix-turn-helix domain-containing protein n=1 Tax=Jeotgalibacillus aurantiacus TaxID=2763266 RepID=UPI001D0A2EF0|nr:helix-turn-helix domain-containing protein [Jeotgalibacillus aurantiacus]
MTYYLSEYQTFNSVQELNHHIDLYRNDLTATQFRVLWLVSNYAVKYPGAAHLKASTIAEALDVSTKTIYRALTALVDAGAIVKHVQFRPKSGGQGATIYCVQPHVSTRELADNPPVPTHKSMKSENETADSINLKNNVLDTVNTADMADTTSNEVPASVLRDFIPQAIYDTITRYFGSASEVYSYYGVMLRAKASICRAVRFEDDPVEYINVIERCIFAWKMGKLKKSFEALLYASVQNATLAAIRRQDQCVNGLFEWIEN